jgi:secreted trypsin-like serine protease
MAVGAVIVAVVELICVDAMLARTSKKADSPYSLAKKKLQQGKLQGRPKIIDGKRAAAGAYPFQVAVILGDAKKGKEFDGLFCGGTMIAPNWVLTAGHCVSDEDQLLEAKDLNVYVGSINFKNGDRIAVKTIIRHEKYDAEYIDNDVALLKLERAPKKEIKYQSIKVIEAGNEAAVTKVGTAATIIGWGATESSDSSNTLLEASVKTVDAKLCSTNIIAQRAKDLDDDLSGVVRRFRIDKKKAAELKDTIVRSSGSVVTDNMMCAGEPASSPAKAKVHDTCWGDSGGPLLVTTPSGPLQVGIVSWGEDCGLPDVFGVYTRVARFSDWIKKNAKD